METIECLFVGVGVNGKWVLGWSLSSSIHYPLLGFSCQCFFPQETDFFFAEDTTEDVQITEEMGSGEPNHQLADRRCFAPQVCFTYHSHITIFLCIGDNYIYFCWGWGKWKLSARVKSEYPNLLSYFGFFIPVFFFHRRLIIFLSVELACWYLVYIVLFWSMMGKMISW